VSLDINGVRLEGLIKHRGNLGARVIYDDGTLYVLRSPSDIAVFSDIAEPKRWGGGWKVRVGEKSLQVMRPTCSCKKDPKLAALTLDEIKAAVSIHA
jgi:hypothetical protein